MTAPDATPPAVWQDATQPAEVRVANLLAQMTVPEKVAQLYGVWVGLDDTGNGVAPHQHEFSAAPPDWSALIALGLGQLTRPFGTVPIDPITGARGLAATQREIVRAGRFGVPALVHEECLTGLSAWQASVFPAPLSWGASFDPETVEAMAVQIGSVMRSLGIHQGLSPVLDVTRDLRWGRTEETIGEDPFLVGTVGSAYVRGLESTGVVATLKHFVGYSASKAGRNLAPVSLGARELADVLLPPFEMALQAGARSVMNSYCDIDGVPVAADPSILTELLRETYGFEGTVVSDYFAVAFLETLHAVASGAGAAAALALTAGIDVELPTVNYYGPPLVDAVAAGLVDEALVDRAATRVLLQKLELGLLDVGWSPDPPALEAESIDLDGPESRAVARRLAERSVVLLANDGALPLAADLRVGLVGPRAAESSAMLGCYSFPLHVGAQHPEVPIGVSVPSVLDALSARFGSLTFAAGGTVWDSTDAEIASAVQVARSSDVCVAVLGDLAGLFGRGTSGEGCDADDLRLPGRQEELLDALLDTGTPVVLVLLVGRPYELSRQAHRLAAVVAGFFPGEEGASALADVLTGVVNPSGRLPVSFPGPASTQPSTYLASPLAQRSQVSTVDPTALYPFGHGLSYAPVTWAEVSSSGEAWPTDGSCEVTVALQNPHDRSTTEVVQVYLHDTQAEVVRPVQQLIAYARVELDAGEARTVSFSLHADLTSFTGLAGRRIVEPGVVELRVGASSRDVRATVKVELVGPRREVGFDRVRTPVVS